MSNVLVAYFSATGTTARVARAVAKASGADLFEISPQLPYSAADLNWTNPKSRCCLEHKDPSCRPALAEKTPDMTQYEVLLLGFPIWWGVSPRPVDTFLEQINGFKGRVIVFATSGGSSVHDTLEQLKAWYPQLQVESAKLLHGSDVREWVKTLKL